MQRILYILSVLIAFCCAMRSWQFNISVTIFIFDLLALIFMVIFLITNSNSSKFHIPKELRYFMLFLCLSFVTEVTSGISIIQMNGSQESFSQYYKYLLTTLFHTVFFFFFIIYLSGCDKQRRKNIVNAYIAGVVCSGMYGIVQLAIWKYFNINIESIIWNKISYNANLIFWEDPTWAVLGIPRGVGFPGVNAAATYTVTILPLLTYYLASKINMKTLVAFLFALFGLLVTMSRTGLLSFAVALFLLAFLNRRLFSGMIKIGGLLSFPSLYLIYLGWEYITTLIVKRSAIDFSRIDLYLGAIHLFFQYPLGIGLNNYSVVRQFLPSHLYQTENLHNSWLTILVETGLPGFIVKTTWIIFVILSLLVKRKAFSNCTACALIGLCAGALFNQLFDLFYFLFFVTLFFTVSVLDNDTRMGRIKNLNII